MVSEINFLSVQFAILVDIVYDLIGNSDDRSSIYFEGRKVGTLSCVSKIKR